MNDLTRAIVANDPGTAELFKNFEEYQEEFERLLDLLGGRTVMVEAPPAANTDAVFRANVSSTRR